MLLRSVVIRLVISLAIVGLGLFLFVWRPQHFAKIQADTHMREVLSLNSSLETAARRLNNTSGPNSIKPRAPGQAKAYVQEVARLYSPLNVNKPKIPKKVLAIDPKLKHFNEITHSLGYSKVLTKADKSAKNAYHIVDHHVMVMRALQNVIEYDPMANIGSAPPDAALNQIIQMRSGLEKATVALKQAEDSSDPALSQTQKLISQLYDQAVTIAVDGKLNQANLSAFDSAFLQAQVQILQNRQEFWDKYKPPTYKSLFEAQQKLNAYIELLRN